MADYYISGIGIRYADIDNINSLWDKINDVKYTFPEKKEPLNTETPEIRPRRLRGVNHFNKLTLACSLSAVKDTSLSYTEWNPLDIGTIFSSCSGAITERLEFGRDVAKGKPNEINPSNFANISPNAGLAQVCMQLNCKGFSTMLHGSNPLILADTFLSQGCTPVCLTGVTETFNLEMASAFDTAVIKKNISLQEGAFTFLLTENSELTESYCSVTMEPTLSLPFFPPFESKSLSSENIEQLKKYHSTIIEQSEVLYDAILPMNTATPFDYAEHDVLTDLYPGVPILNNICGHGKSGIHLHWYLNLAVAALCAKKQVLPYSLLPEDTYGSDLEKTLCILVTGYDACGNYTAITIKSCKIVM